MRHHFSLIPALPRLPQVRTYFLLFESSEQEEECARFPTQGAEVAPIKGINLRVVDLTR